MLQPVVENAIIHGVEPLDRRGAISIRGYLQDEKILFVITDNGVGMEKEQVEKMLNNRCNIEKGRFSGVGIGNVNSRMQLIFGEQYGLTIKSEKNMFTSVVIAFRRFSQERIIVNRVLLVDDDPIVLIHLREMINWKK
ncbi:MAG: ATP-binding protein [Lachnospiraceae bacterium]